MSVSDQITRLQNAKAAIKTSIENKGVTVGDDVKLDAYPALIDSIEAGGGSGETYENPEFYDIRTQNGTDFDHLFANIHFGFGSFDESFIQFIENLDTSKVTNMDYTFSNTGWSFAPRKYLDLSKWKTDNIKSTSYAFYSSSYIQSISLAGCNFSNLEEMDNMFYYCDSLITIDFSGCDTSKVTRVESMFNYCINLTTVTGELDLSNLNKGFYPASYNNPVSYCNKLETLYLKNIYKKCTMTNDSKWSINLSPTKIKDECLLYIINELPDLYAKGLTATDKITFTLPLTNTLTAEQVQPAIDKGWQVANVNY